MSHHRAPCCPSCFASAPRNAPCCYRPPSTLSVDIASVVQCACTYVGTHSFVLYSMSYVSGAINGSYTVSRNAGNPCILDATYAGAFVFDVYQSTVSCAGSPWMSAVSFDLVLSIAFTKGAGIASMTSQARVTASIPFGPTLQAFLFRGEVVISDCAGLPTRSFTNLYTACTVGLDADMNAGYDGTLDVTP